VRVKGLMAIPPYSFDPNGNRKYFEQMRVLYDTFKNFSDGFEYLSMGMSGDFEAAIIEGANIIRIGTAVFGARSQ